MSHRELLCRLTSDRKPHFTSDPFKSVSQLQTGHSTHCWVLTFVFFLHSLSLILSSFLLILFISTSLAASTALTLPLTGSAAVDDMYPTESRYGGSMDRSTERRDSPTYVFVYLVCFHCVCVSVYVCLWAYCESNRTHSCKSNMNLTVRKYAVCANVCKRKDHWRVEYQKLSFWKMKPQNFNVNISFSCNSMCKYMWKWKVAYYYPWINV